MFGGRTLRPQQIRPQLFSSTHTIRPLENSVSENTSTQIRPLDYFVHREIRPLQPRPLKLVHIYSSTQTRP
jgi:hypothetical protein